jgi:hypothetical protein
MPLTMNKRVVAAASVLALGAAGGGAAIAASATQSPAAESRAIVDDAASQLGVEPAALTAALKEALRNRIDAARAAGEITAAEAAELKERIASDEFPLFGRHGPGGRVHGHVGLDAAAAYLGLTRSDLRERLHEGATLAQVAERNGKTVAGLVDAIVGAERGRLAADVEAGRITDAQRDEIVAGLRARVEEMVNRTRPPRPGFSGHGV